MNQQWHQPTWIKLWQRQRGKRLLAVLLAIATCFCVSLLPTLATATSATAIAPAPTQAIAQGDPLQDGKSLYDAGQYEQAAALLEQAVQSLRSRAEPLSLAATLANLALTYQQLGAWEKAQAALQESLQLLANQPPSDRVLQVKAQTLEILGRLQLAQGNSETALATWQQAEGLYRQLQDPAGAAKAQLNQTQALRSLGFYRRALDQLMALSQTLQDQPDTRQKALTLRALGESLQLVGNLDQARASLESSLKLTEALQLPAESAATLLSLGNTARAQKQPDAAIAYYQQVATLSASPLTNVQAQLNQLNLLIDQKQWTGVQGLLPQIPSALQQLPPSRAGVYAHINFAQALLNLSAGNNSAAAASGSSPAIVAPSPFSVIPYPQSISKLLRDTLEQAIVQARQLQDKRAESYALGTLGAVYEQTNQLTEARTVTQQALVLAQSSNTGDIAYRWQWQLGRLLQQTDLDAAIAAYDTAITNLRSLRADLVAVNPDVQFNFREEVEPVYRQSVELLLKSQETIQDEREKAKVLEKARERIEALQLAELDNFFREACLEGQRVILDDVVDKENPTTAIIYPIVLRQPETRTVEIKVIAKIPGKPLQVYSSSLAETEFNTTLSDLQNLLADPPTAANRARLRSRAQTIYSWLVAPVDQAIQANETSNLKASSPDASPTSQTVNTLVFVLDDALRNIPMALLWDGNQYLIEKYSLGLSLGLQLFDPKPIAREPLRILAAGLSEPPKNSPQAFAPLPNVQAEISSIAELGVSTTALVEQEFTKQALEARINAAPYNVIHLATHGLFGSQAENTYILAADGPINVTEFDSLLRSRDVTRPEAIELLVLSACQTATNDRRATLGLAGFAVRAGARSTLASLRNVSDESTPQLIEEFYKQLSNTKEPVTKAEALRRAQLSLLNGPNRDFQNPQYWAAYVLVGNWL